MRIAENLSRIGRTGFPVPLGLDVQPSSGYCIKSESHNYGSYNKLYHMAFMSSVVFLAESTRPPLAVFLRVFWFCWSGTIKMTPIAWTR